MMKRILFTLLTLALLAMAVVCIWKGIELNKQYSNYVATTARSTIVTTVGCSSSQDDCSCDGVHYKVKWSYEVNGKTITTRQITEPHKPSPSQTIYYNPAWPVSHTFTKDHSLLFTYAVVFLLAAIFAAARAYTAFRDHE